MEEKKISNQVKLIIVIALAAVVLISLGIFVDKIMQYNQIQKEKADIENNIEAINEDIEELEYRYDSPMDDKYVESVAKSELDLVNPEDIIVYKDVEGKEP